MSFRVEYQANDGQIETLTFGNEAAAQRFASTKKLAVVTPCEGDAPDVAVKQLAPRGLAKPRKAPKARKPAAPRAAPKAPAERRQSQGPSLMASIMAMLSKKAA